MTPSARFPGPQRIQRQATGRPTAGCWTYSRICERHGHAAHGPHLVDADPLETILGLRSPGDIGLRISSTATRTDPGRPGRSSRPSATPRGAWSFDVAHAASTLTWRWPAPCGQGSAHDLVHRHGEARRGAGYDRRHVHVPCPRHAACRGDPRRDGCPGASHRPGGQARRACRRAPGDAAVLDLEDGDFTFGDAAGHDHGGGWSRADGRAGRRWIRDGWRRATGARPRRTTKTDSAAARHRKPCRPEEDHDVGRRDVVSQPDIHGPRRRPAVPLRDAVAKNSAIAGRCAQEN